MKKNNLKETFEVLAIGIAASVIIFHLNSMISGDDDTAAADVAKPAPTAVTVPADSLRRDTVVNVARLRSFQMNPKTR